jgi:glycosyltransferase involved in cell wall biosynthesis
MRVALVRDFAEEGWPSMDLVGDMLFRNLAEHCATQIAVSQLCPRFHSRLTLIPMLPSKLAANGDRWINRFVQYPLWLRHRRSQYDLFHVIDHSYSQLVHSFPAGRTVVTCHDLDTFRCLLDPAQERRPRWFRAMTRRILDGLQRAAHVIAVSAATREELLKHKLISAERISVIPNGVHPACSLLPEPAADGTASALIGRAHPDQPILLNVGSTLPRKRLDVLLRVFAAVRAGMPDARLVRVGGFTSEQERLAADLNIRDAIVSLPFLERDVLAAVYRSATLLVHTAESEGFGLPLVEAMACGCTVIASDIPVLREVGGSAAIYCRVADVDDWRITVTRLLRESTQNRDRWELYRAKSLENAARFSWAENARQTSLVYRKVLERE